MKKIPYVRQNEDTRKKFQSAKRLPEWTLCCVEIDFDEH